MPESYTLIYTASQALARSGNTVASPSAFRAGATGFAPFFLYQLWKKRPRPNLPELAAHMRHEKTGEFLLALVRYATTATQQSYALGFLCCYTASCTLSPYSAAMSAPGAPYDLPDGNTILACALDTELYHRDYKTRTIQLHASTPVLLTEELAQVTALLRETIRAVYQKNVPQVALADAFHTNLLAHKMLLSAPGRLFLNITNPSTHSAFGPLRYRAQPGKRLLPLPATWVNPHSQVPVALTYPQLLSLAERSGAICITSAMRYWLGLLEESDLLEIFGNNDYDTGLPGTAAPAAEPLRE